MKKLVLLLTVLTTFYFSNGNPLWMRYASISPDGKTIVFSYQGDLFTVDASGGNANYLTSHVAYDYQPVWSKDGKKIAFASNRYGNFDIFLIDAKGGIPEQLTNFSGSEKPSSFSIANDKILFAAQIQDDVKNAQFPSGVLPELYAVDIKTKNIEQVLTTPAIDAKYNSKGNKIVYNDSKGYEDKWRKHHQSSVTRDIWVYDVKSGNHKKVTTFKGEDREPVFAPGNDNKIYYLTEQFGTFNVASLDIDKPAAAPVQITKFKKHPVRFLSVANDGTLCFTYNGEIFTQKGNAQPQKVNVQMQHDLKTNSTGYTTLSGISEMEVSPNGKEIVYISRGEVFVTKVDYSTTKRITNTPEQERSVSFSPDGKSIIYASERNNSWNIYQTKLVRKDEKFFSNSTILKEEPILITDKETFQPKFSPDGKKIAYLEERTILKVLDLASKKSVTIMDGYKNYSYSDGDQYFDWSPDSRWMLVEFSPNSLFSNDVGLVKADGTGKVINLTQSGYNSIRPKWMLDGKMMIFSSDKYGYRSHGSWGAEYDVYGMFFTKDAYDVFKLSKEEYEIYKKEKKEKDKEKEKSKDKEDAKKDKAKDKKVEPIKIDLDGIEDRIVRLTINSSALSDAVISKDGEKLYYLSRFEKGADLWMKDLRKNETKLLIKMSGYYGSLHLADDGKKLFVFSGGRIYEVNTKAKSKKPIAFSSNMNLDTYKEKKYMFDHIWRQVKKKFYVADLHGVDWKMMKANYIKFLPHINNNFDYAEMLSEMLGELNGSHTGARYRPSSKGGNSTASLGILWDWNYKGAGIKIAEIIKKGPLDKAASEVSAGSIITKINDKAINNLNDYFAALNHQSGKNVLVTIKKDGKEVEEVVKPISWRYKNNLLYKRWIKNRRDEVEKLSKGKIGYIHVRGMNSYSFRDFYADLLGKNHEKEAIIVDTRFNGGGWLHDDLATTLNGKEYVKFNIRGKYYGKEPMNKWTKPSAVIMGEGNYSDAHGFPYTYKTLGIGKLVGMPVPGTMTAVWWERLQDPSLIFGIPQVGTQDANGNYLENQQLEPDVKVRQDYEVVAKGKDQQIEKAVETLLKEIK